MANLIMTAGELHTLLVSVQPAVKLWAQNLIEEREKCYAERRKELDEATRLPSKMELESMIRDHYLSMNEKRKWWQRKYSWDEATLEIQKNLSINRMYDKNEVMSIWQTKMPDPDYITPTIHYLSALVKRLDPETIISLSDKESHQMQRALELARVK